jgi:hypothetical protein
MVQILILDRHFGQIPMIQYDGITIRDMSNMSAQSDEVQSATLPSVDVSVLIVTDKGFINSINVFLLGALIVSLLPPKTSLLTNVKNAGEVCSKK